MTENTTEATAGSATEATAGSAAEATAQNSAEATAQNSAEAMTGNAAEAWPEPPLAGTEAAAVLGALERQRATLAWKCSGLDAAGLQATVGASAVTLGGLLKHLAHVEDSHFARLWLGVPAGAPWDAVDWDGDPDWAYRSAAQDAPGQLRALWQESTDRSRATVDAALSAGGGLDQLGAYVTRSGERPNLRRILLDLIEEYARHVGHADLIRESVDGLTGEDPPR